MQLSRTAIWVGLAVTAGTAACAGQDLDSKYENDPRLERLTYFLTAYRCPVSNLAVDFIAAADRHRLDWRLLPSIAIIETSCGRAQKRQNLFGWASARKGFASLRAGIYAVAERLENSRLYRGKELDALLRTYNRYPGYARRVKQIMLKVDPTEPLRARRADVEVEQAALHNPPLPLGDAALLPESRLDLAALPSVPAGWGAPQLSQPFE